MKKYHFLTSWRHHKDFRYDDHIICECCPKQNEDISEQHRLGLMERWGEKNCEECYHYPPTRRNRRVCEERKELLKIWLAIITILTVPTIAFLMLILMHLGG